MSGPAIEGVLETCLYCEDLEAAKTFYGDVLELELLSEQLPRHVFFRCGRQMLLLFNPRQSCVDEGEVPPHGASGPGHVAFRVPPEELDAWARKLSAANVPIECTVQWKRGHSIYFRDPAGNSLELAPALIWGL